VEFRILGPIEVYRDGVPVGVRTGRTRSLLALLLARAPHPVTVDAAIELLWTDRPSSAKAQVHNMISGLRRATAEDGGQLVISRGASYRVELAGHTLDLAEFRRAAAAGRRALTRGEGELATMLLAEALGWWRGPALADAVEPLAGAVRHGLDAEWLAATELRLDAELAVGRYQAALDGVRALLAEHAYREDLYCRQMLALCGLGRRTEALAAYRQAYRRLVDDLGIEPGRELRDLHRQVLDGSAPLPRHPGPGAAAIAAVPVPAQLPPAVERLHGRDELLAGIRAALAGRGVVAPAVVVLTGPGGIGKSALAVHAAHLLAAEFAGGQLYADLRGSHEVPAGPHDVAGRFLRALGVPGEQVPADADERIGQLRSVLAGRRVLVVLDDARDEAQVRPLLPGAAGCAVVITSRRRLDALAGAVTRVVPTLSPDAARRLLADAARPAGPLPGDGTGAEIARLCGYLPLAIRIAGARLAARPDWTLAQLHRRLAGQRTRLDELAIGDLDVRASIALSYRSLPGAQRLMLRRLGLLDAGDVPSWVPAALAGDAPDAVLDGLVSCHLVQLAGADQAGQARFRLHDLVHEFARERAIEEDTPAARRDAVVRVLRGWLALTAEAGQRLELDRPPSAPARDGAHRAALPVARGRAYDWFEAERGNLLAAVHQAIALDDAGLASDLTVQTGGFLQVRNYLADREAIAEAAIACLERHGAPGQRLLRHLDALFTAYGQHDLIDRMEEIADRKMRLAVELGDQAAEAVALQQRASVAYRRGRLTEASQLDRLSLGRVIRLGLPARQLAEARHSLAVGLAELGDPAAAAPLFREALDSGELGGRARAILLADYAEALVECGRLAEAATALDEAAEIVARIGDEVGAGRVRVFLADLAVAERDWPAARSHLDAALVTLTTHDDTNGRIFALRRLTDIALGEGHAPRAAHLAQQAMRLARRVGAQVETVRALARLAIAADLHTDHAAAHRYRREYHRILTDLELPDTCLRLPRHLRPGAPSRRTGQPHRPATRSVTQAPSSGSR